MSDSDNFGCSSDVPHSDLGADVKQAREEWAAIDDQQAALAQLPTEAGVGHIVIDRGYPITFFDSRFYLVNQSQRVLDPIPALVENPPRLCCLSVRNSSVHIEAWRTIFRMSKLEFDEFDLTHHRILNTLHSLITGCGTPPLRRGDHWLTIGFQSDDPIRDLRAAGMLGLLLPLHLFAKFDALGTRLVQTARMQGHEFPLMLILINMTMDVIDVAGNTQLIKSGRDFDGCWDQMAFFFAGIVQTLCEEWTRDQCEYVRDFDRFQRIAQRAKTAPAVMTAVGKRVLANASRQQPQLQPDS
jgi:hypothetical protein